MSPTKFYSSGQMKDQKWFRKRNLKLWYGERSSGVAHLIHYFSNAAWLWLLIRSVGIFRSFQLNLQSFHSDLETIHRLNSCLSTGRIIKWNKTCGRDKTFGCCTKSWLNYGVVCELTETFTLVCSAVDKNFWTNNGAERHKHLHQFAITKLLRQMINKKITAFGSRYGASWEHQKRLINYEIPGGRVGIFCDFRI